MLSEGGEQWNYVFVNRLSYLVGSFPVCHLRRKEAPPFDPKAITYIYLGPPQYLPEVTKCETANNRKSKHQQTTRNC